MNFSVFYAHETHLETHPIGN